MKEDELEKWQRMWDEVKDSEEFKATSQYKDPMKEFNDLLSEGQDKDRVKDVADALAKSQNPIKPTSVGKDSEVKSWDKESEDIENINKLSELKVKLEKLESACNADYAMGKAIGSCQKQIDDIKKKIDELSDKLSGHQFDQY